MTDETESPPYHVEPDGEGFQVVNESGRQMVACANCDNAEHYAALLNQAYQHGYKAGYRAAKRS